MRPFYNYYQCDTVCGLIEYLDENGIAPENVQLYGIYSGKNSTRHKLLHQH